MTAKRDSVKVVERYARKVCLVIGFFGVIILALFNWNCQLIFSGNKYAGKVLNIQKEGEKCYQIEIEFIRLNGSTVQKTISDCTGESFLFWIKKGESIKLWESKNKPYKYYVPFANFAVKIFLAFFFIFIPFLFAIYGRY